MSTRSHRPERNYTETQKGGKIRARDRREAPGLQGRQHGRVSEAAGARTGGPSGQPQGALERDDPPIFLARTHALNEAAICDFDADIP